MDSNVRKPLSIQGSFISLISQDDVRTVLLLFVLVVVSYLRGFPLPGGLTTSYLLIPLVFLGIIIITVNKYNVRTITFEKRWILWAGLVGWLFISFVYNIFFRPRPTLSIRFAAELLLNIQLLIVVVSLLNRQVLKRIFRGFVGVSALFAVFLLSYRILLGSEEIRRLGGVQISGAVNNIAQMIAVAIVLAVVGLVCAESWRKKWLELVALLFLTPVLIFSSSRSAIIGLVLALGVLFAFQKRKIKKIVALLGAGLTSTILLLFTFFGWSGSYRFSVEFLIIGVNNRINDYSRGIINAGFTPPDVLFGGGMYRSWNVVGQDSSVTEPLFYPHNFVIDMYVLVGIPAAILFSIILLKNGQSLIYMALIENDEAEYLKLATLLIMFPVFLHAFTGGTVTRDFIVWMVLGISEFLYLSFGNQYSQGRSGKTS